VDIPPARNTEVIRFDKEVQRRPGLARVWRPTSNIPPRRRVPPRGDNFLCTWRNTMSYGTATLTNSAPRADRIGLIAGMKLLLLSLLMMFSSGVLADPAAANQSLSMAKQRFEVVKLDHQIAKLQLQQGNTNAARTSFTMEQIEAAGLTANLMRLLNDNKDTFDRGMYRDGTSQQRAINFTAIAKQHCQVLETQLVILTMQPTSQIDLILAEMSMTQLTQDLRNIEQAMADAQR
jgi:hypothetical protein